VSKTTTNKKEEEKRILNGWPMPLDLFLSDEVPLTLKIQMVLLHYANLGRTTTSNNDLRGILCPDRDHKKFTPKLHNALEKLAARGVLLREYGQVTYFVGTLPDTPKEDPRIKVMGAIENKLRGWTEPTGGWRHLSLKAKLTGRYEEGIAKIKWRIPVKQLAWLFGMGMFENPRVWVHLNEDLSKGFLRVCYELLSDEGLTKLPVEEVGILMAVEAMYFKHLDGYEYKNPIGFLRNMVKEVALENSSVGDKNASLVQWNTEWMAALGADMPKRKPASYYLSRWAEAAKQRRAAVPDPDDEEFNPDDL